MPQIQKPFPLPPQDRVGYAIVGLGKFALNQIIPSFAESQAVEAGGAGQRQSGRRREQVAERYGVDKKAIYDYAGFNAHQGQSGDRRRLHHPAQRRCMPNTRSARLKAGKHVMCEKPMAPTVAECEAMIRAERQGGPQADDRVPGAVRTVQPGSRCGWPSPASLGTLKLVVSDHGRNLDPSDPGRPVADERQAGRRRFALRHRHLQPSGGALHHGRGAGGDPGHDPQHAGRPALPRGRGERDVPAPLSLRRAGAMQRVLRLCRYQADSWCRDRKPA